MSSRFTQRQWLQERILDGSYNPTKEHQDLLNTKFVSRKAGDIHSRHQELIQARRRMQVADAAAGASSSPSHMTSTIPGVSTDLSESPSNRPIYCIRNVGLSNLNEVRDTIGIRRDYFRDRLLLGSAAASAADESDQSIGSSCQSEADNNNSSICTDDNRQGVGLDSVSVSGSTCEDCASTTTSNMTD